MDFKDIDKQFQAMESDSKVKAAKEKQYQKDEAEAAWRKGTEQKHMTKEHKPEGTPAHRLVGLTDEQNEDILKDVVAVLSEAKLMDLGITKLAERYDPISLIAGMRLMQLMAVNNKLYESGRNTRQKPSLN